MDEVYVFDRILADAEIRSLAPDRCGLRRDLRYQHESIALGSPRAVRRCSLLCGSCQLKFRFDIVAGSTFVPETFRQTSPSTLAVANPAAFIASDSLREASNQLPVILFWRSISTYQSTNWRVSSDSRINQIDRLMLLRKKTLSALPVLQLPT